jgi:hypothetical protein
MEAALARGTGVATATQLSRKGEASRRLEGPCEESHLPGRPRHGGLLQHPYHRRQHISESAGWVAMAWGDACGGVCMSRWEKEMGRVAQHRMERNAVIGNCMSPAGAHVAGRSEPRGKTAAARRVYGCAVSG